MRYRIIKIQTPYDYGYSVWSNLVIDYWASDGFPTLRQAIKAKQRLIKKDKEYANTKSFI